jgi:bud emergence protein 1
VQQNTQQPVQPNSFASKSTSQLYAPISARIPRYCFAEEKYWFVIEAVLEDGRSWELSRYYEDFYDFQIALLTEFPAEAGNTGTQKRSLPYMPGPVNYVTDAITEGRLHNLDAYVKNLLAQPAYISKCNLVKQFFAPREGDYEIDPASINDEYRNSGASQHSSSESRQSSKQNLSGNNVYAQAAAPPQNQQPGLQPPMSRQVSSLSQPSQSSLSPGVQQAGAALKIKLSYNGDLFAIRVPSDVQFRELYARIVERLKTPPGEELVISYKDEQSGDKLPLISDADLDFALQHNEKLLLYIE